MGDVFDLAFGSYLPYLENYSFFFNFVQQALNRGQEVHFVEGNHDLHLEELFDNRENFYYHKGGFFKKWQGKNIYFYHGDDLFAKDGLYLLYRHFMAYGLFRLLTKTIIPYTLVEWVGRKASRWSRQKNKTRYKASKEKIRPQAQKQCQQKGCDILVSGHTHVKDYFVFPEGTIYINNGYAPKENSFIYLSTSASEPSFVEL